MTEPPAAAVNARVVHAVPGRVRIRLTGMSSANLLSLRERLGMLPGVVEARANPRTGSLLIQGNAVTPQSLERAAAAVGLRLNEPLAARPLIEHFLESFDSADNHLRHATGGRLDIASIAMLALLGTAAVQIARGQFAAPAITILWYAASTVLMARSARSGPG